MNATFSPTVNSQSDRRSDAQYAQVPTTGLNSDAYQSLSLSPIDCADLNFATYTLERLFEKLEEHADPDSGKAKRYGRIAEFLREINDEASRSDWTPEDATGWAVSLTLVSAENRLQSLNPDAYILVNALADMFIHAARLLEVIDVPEIGTAIKSQMDASLDFISNGAPGVAAA